MGITFQFILLFVLIIIPGLLFKRLYFFGEFSKQFNTKDTVYKAIFYSIIPGIIIQISIYWIYVRGFSPDFSHDDVVCIFKELFSNDFGYSDPTISFMNGGVSSFIIYCVCVNAAAAIFGFLGSRLVRFFRLDISSKFLRFKNQWYYIFSGEIRSFKKFNKLHTIGTALALNIKKDNKYKYYPPYADILVNQNGKTELYTGYVVDYDLSYENISHLDKIYLIGAHRYRPLKSVEYDNNLKIFGNKVKKAIEGDIFILKAEQILNMNLTFIPHLEEGKGNKVKESGYPIIYRAGMILTGLWFVYVVFYPLIDGVESTLGTYIGTHSLGGRFLLAILGVQLISVIIPNKEKAENKREPSNYYYNYKIIVYKSLSLGFWFLIYYFAVRY